MKKFYSFVLMAAALLIGTNTWAALNQVQVVDETTPAQSGTYSSLQEAINAVKPGDVATLKLLGEQRLTKAVSIPYVVGEVTATNKNVLEREPQVITLDLNGFDILDDPDNTKVPSPIGCFELLKGTLHITGAGMIKNTRTGATANNEPTGYADVANVNIRHSAIAVFGAPRSKGKKEDAVWSHLIIDENVFVYSAAATDGSDKNFGIVVDLIGSGATPQMSAAGKMGYDNQEANGASKKGTYGIFIEIKGKVYGSRRGINIAGNINASPATDEGWGDELPAEKGRRYADPTAEGWKFYYDYRYPYFKVYDKAEIYCYNSGIVNDGNGGIYGGGYCVFDIEGANIHGQTGIMAKSGDYVLTNATVSSDSPISAQEGHYHGDCSGTGIFIASDKSYAGYVNVVLNGGTTVIGGGNAAIVDVLASGTNLTSVENLQINGANIEAGNEGAISLSTGTATNTTVTGGTISGNITIGQSQASVESLIQGDDYHTTVLDDGNGNKTVVVTQGKVTYTTGNKVSNQATDAVVKWEGAEFPEDEITGYLRLKELVINDTITDSEGAEASEVGQPREQTLTIADGAILEVGHVILGSAAQIVVAAGGKLIVTGDDGIISREQSNIVLETQEGKPSIFVLNPNVKNNRYPKATVKFISKSRTWAYGPNDFTKQRFGIPTIGQLTAMTTQYNNENVQTALSKFNGEDWVDFGWINVQGKTAHLDQMKDPFAYYQMQHNTPESGTVVTMKGQLVGNWQPTLKIKGNYWNGFANSYMAPIKGSKLIALIPETVDKAFYLYNVHADYADWKSYTLLNIASAQIDPMQPFLIRNAKAAADIVLNYAEAVYNPVVESLSPAPARRSTSLNDITKVQFNVKGQKGSDCVIVAEDAQFTAEFDNGYDAVKYMNEGVNMYVTSDEKMSIFATDNLDNTYVGFQTVNGGTYTIEFSEVQGEELIFIDHETNAHVAMVEGNKYEFTAAANSVNDYRFEIVGVAKMPTAIENTEVKANVKGIFTLTGQYLGEMNVWNTLPAGVYVVNGAKRVK